MKSFFRSGPMVSLLGVLIWGWMVLVARTVRWQVEGKPEGLEAWGHAPGILLASWHSKILLLPAVWSRQIRQWPKRDQRIAMLISLSKDGEPVAKAIKHLGIDSIRGSAANKKKQNKDKGGVRAVADAIRRLKAGGGVCITPDGPRGPREIASPGAVLLAQRSGAPILPFGVATAPSKRLNSWDRFLFPFPFTRGAIVFGAPVYAARDDNADDLLQALQDSLDIATARAESLLGLEPIALDTKAS